MGHYFPRSPQIGASAIPTRNHPVEFQCLLTRTRAKINVQVCHTSLLLLLLCRGHQRKPLKQAPFKDHYLAVTRKPRKLSPGLLKDTESYPGFNQLHGGCGFALISIMNKDMCREV